MTERQEYAWGLACLHAATAARCGLHDRHTARRLIGQAMELMEDDAAALAAAEAFGAAIGQEPEAAGRALLVYVTELAAEMCADQNAALAAGVLGADAETGFDWQRRADIDG